ncbi:hypothetical protein DERP_002786 [Dermatophagoides pteronyssinus]|uniref:Uncharacterized protein n=1 Tax=Dermatophagoides pteronyssinus TaxID=6956 RepID=A0ABQ8JWR0_DERPT|nr:hypothetical protein DERP_002786 [Dermatophagoides pteronyssinus]
MEKNQDSCRRLSGNQTATIGRKDLWTCLLASTYTAIYSQLQWKKNPQKFKEYKLENNCSFEKNCQTAAAAN